MGDYFTDAANEHTYPGHDLLHFRVTWQASDQFNLFTSIRNLTNERYAERADFFFGNERFFPGESLSVSGGLSITLN